MNIKKTFVFINNLVLDIFSKVHFKNTRVYPRLWQLVGIYISKQIAAIELCQNRQRAEISS